MSCNNKYLFSTFSGVKKCIASLGFVSEVSSERKGRQG